MPKYFGTVKMNLHKFTYIYFAIFSFFDHIYQMFGEEIAAWDEERKYLPENIEVCLKFLILINFEF